MRPAAGSPQGEPSPWTVGGSAGPYEVLERIGAGGMGEVFRVRHRGTGAVRALKTVRSDASPALLLRAQREGEAMARVDDHSNVVRVHSAGSHGGRLCIEMDLAGGGDLDQRLEAGPLADEEARWVLTELARGLAHVHAHGVLHRDLKPANVLFDGEGTPKLSDFGIAGLSEAERLTVTGELLGTPAYMSPEQARGQPTDERTDVYGLGAVLYSALTARPPFEGAGLGLLAQVARDEPVPIWKLNPACDRALVKVCERAMAKAPSARYASAAELLRALEEPGDMPSGGGAGRWLGAAILLLAVGVLGVWAWQEASSGEPAVSEPAPREGPTLEGAPPVEASAVATSTPRPPEWALATRRAELPESRLAASLGPPPPGPYTGEEARPRELREGALRGVTDDMVRLADRLRSANEVSQDLRLSRDWFLRAHLAGDANGTFGAALMLRTMPAVIDLGEAALLFAHLAHRGDFRGVYHLAEMLARGIGLPAQPEEAVRWLELGCRRGEAPSDLFVLLGDLQEEGLGTRRDPEQALANYQVAIVGRRGDPSHFHKLPGGGVGLVRRAWVDWSRRDGGNRARVLEALEAAKGRRHPLALLRLGDVHRRGGDDLRASEHYWLAARASSFWVCRGAAYLRLYGMRQQRGERPAATHSLRQAVAFGSPQALVQLAQRFEGTGSELGLYRLAAQLGDPEGMRRWADALERGTGGVAKDPSAAAGWRRASEVRRRIPPPDVPW